MQQKSLKVSHAVYEDLRAYARARGGLPLGRAIEALLSTEKQRRPSSGSAVGAEGSWQTEETNGA